MPVIRGEKASIHENDGMGYELFEMKAYIKGDWKILRLPAPFGNGEWQLYNTKKDPGEMNDLTEQHPEIKNELLEHYKQYVIQNEVYNHNGVFDALYRQAYGVE